MRTAIVVPCYRHAGSLPDLLPVLERYGFPVIIADDGNEEPVAEFLARDCPGSQAQVIRLEQNSGKGAAVHAGFLRARELGCTHALQIDADGQQDPGAVPRMLELARSHPGDLIAGSPVYRNVPPGRFLARYITHFWVALELGRCSLVDSMCGLRVYPLDPACRILERRPVGRHMGFDTEIMIRMYWAGCGIVQCPVAVSYPAGGISNFRMFRDNLELSWCHARLCTEKILHYPAVRGRRYL